MYLLDRARKKKYEKRCGSTRTDESRKWIIDRGERSMGMETLIVEALAKIFIWILSKRKKRRNRGGVRCDGEIRIGKQVKLRLGRSWNR